MMQRTENKIRDIGCGIMQDLLISYCDGLTAEGVGEMIQTHLTECPACQGHYEELLRQRELEEQQERSRGRSFGRKLASLRYYMLGGIIGVVAPVVFLVLWYLIMSVRSYFEVMFYSYFL